ncbi:MAG: hypothetical protein MR481_05975 [Campylobacter sp.]|uniref:hypothetical protein n=1 Tax=Campylobacter sp. TaxID=205 RepID=UPI002AA912CF|nr:hypothetical protein [Campylobacter sp.]MCI7247453.1 hypothetical protein [Campylobacter sp.]
MEFISILENYFYSKDFWLGFAFAFIFFAPLSYKLGLSREIYHKSFECDVKRQHKKPNGRVFFSTIDISYRCGKITKCDCTYRRKKGLFRRSICTLNNKPCIAKDFVD